MALEKVGTFVLTDESLDRHSERVLVRGVNLTSFKKNPVMFYNHLRTRNSFWNETSAKDANLPIGIWKNVKKADGQILADAYIDFDDDVAIKIGQKIKSGVLKAVSIGFKAIAVSDDPDDKVQGQKGLTITKSELWEASIVDIPSNVNALMVSKVIHEKGVNNKEVANEDIRFVKSFSITEKELIMENKFSLKNWVKSFFGKEVESDEDAQKFLEQQKAEDNKPFDITTSDEFKAVQDEQKALKKSIEEATENSNKKINALTEQVSTLATALKEKAAETKEIKEEKEEREDEFDTKIKALTDEINALKGVRSGNQQKTETPPKVKTETDDGDEDKVIAKNAAELIKAAVSL